MVFKIHKYNNNAQVYQQIAEMTKTGEGILLEYDMDYVFQHIKNDGADRVSLVLDCSFEFFRFEEWPAFILDLIPSGNGKRFLLEKYGRGGDDFLLQVGAWNPIGNLRVTGELTKSFIQNISQQEHVSFTEEDIIQKSDRFLHYAKTCGVQIDGATDVQGDAPKFLVIKGFDDRFYVDSGLVDKDLIKQHYIVKFPRGRLSADFELLKNEAAYLEVACALDLNVGEAIVYKDGALFIPRFDREIIDGKLYCHGVESLYSLAGITERGQISDNFLFCELIARYSSRGALDVLEFLKRDVLNVLLGNPDNHGRNSAMLKKNGEVRLSPLYDFAPMFHDPNDIFMRRSMWFAYEEGGRPDWAGVLGALEKYGKEIHKGFGEFVKSLKNLEKLLIACGVDDFIIEKRTAIIQRELALLEKLYEKD